MNTDAITIIIITIFVMTLSNGFTEISYEPFNVPTLEPYMHIHILHISTWLQNSNLFSFQIENEKKVISYNNFVSFINDPYISTDSNFSMAMMKRKSYNVSMFRKMCPIHFVQHQLYHFVHFGHFVRSFVLLLLLVAATTNIHFCLRVNEISRPKMANKREENNDEKSKN